MEPLIVINGDQAGHLPHWRPGHAASMEPLIVINGDRESTRYPTDTC